MNTLNRDLFEGCAAAQTFHTRVARDACISAGVANRSDLYGLVYSLWQKETAAGVKVTLEHPDKVKRQMEDGKLTLRSAIMLNAALVSMFGKPPEGGRPPAWNPDIDHALDEGLNDYAIAMNDIERVVYSFVDSPLADLSDEAEEEGPWAPFVALAVAEGKISEKQMDYLLEEWFTERVPVAAFVWMSALAYGGLLVALNNDTKFVTIAL